MTAKRHSKVWMIAGALASLTSIDPPPAPAIEYQFSIIAEPGDVIQGRTITRFSPEDNPIAINNNREVVFMASVDGPSNWSIMTPDRFIAGAGKVVDDVVPFFDNEDHRISINDAGQVAYKGLLNDGVGTLFGGGAIFVGQAKLVGIGDVVDNRTITSVDFDPVINRGGTVAFVATYEENVGPAVFTQHELVAEFGQSFGDITLGRMFRPVINDGGVITFSGGILEENSTGIFTKHRLMAHPAELNTDGSLRTPHDIIDGRIISGDLQAIGIDSAGEVAFSAVISAEAGPLARGVGIFTQHARLAETGAIIDGLEIHGFPGGAQYNNVGSLAFFAELSGGAALFSGQEFVVGTRDAIDDRLIESFHPWLAMNDRGDLAFLAHFENGTSAIVLATVPEPSTILQLSCSIAFLLPWRRTRRAARNVHCTHATVPGRFRVPDAKEGVDHHVGYSQKPVETTATQETETISPFVFAPFGPVPL